MNKEKTPTPNKQGEEREFISKFLDSAPSPLSEEAKSYLPQSSIDTGVEEAAKEYAKKQWVDYDEEYKWSRYALEDCSYLDFIAGAKWASPSSGEAVESDNPFLKMSDKEFQEWWHGAQKEIEEHMDKFDREQIAKAAEAVEFLRKFIITI